MLLFCTSCVLHNENAHKFRIIKSVVAKAQQNLISLIGRIIINVQNLI